MRKHVTATLRQHEKDTQKPQESDSVASSFTLASIAPNKVI